MLLLLLGLCLLSAVRADNSSDSFLKDIWTAVENRCKNNGDNNSFLELQATFAHFDSCMHRNSILLQNSTDPVKESCKMFFPIMSKCAKNVLDKLEPCLNPQEKYLPDFIISSLRKGLGLNCEDKQALLEKSENVTKALKNCPYLESGPFSAGPIPEKCTLQLQIVQNLAKPDFILEKQDVCSDVESLMECTIEIVKSKCDSEPVLLELIKRNFGLFTSWCQQNLPRSQIK